MPLEVQLSKVGDGGRGIPLNGWTPPHFMPVQDRTWISNVICRGLVCI